MKIVITGGHLSPAFSVIENLPKSAEVLIIGRKYTFEGDANLSFEYLTAQKKGIPFHPIVTGRFQREFTKYTIPSLLKIPRGFFESISILRRFKPDVVMSFGGYVSFPVVASAKLLRIPVVIHEQTLGAGLANKLAASFANSVLISWESSRQFFPKEKTILTGNPIRKFKVTGSKFKFPEGNVPLVYITGGSAGSHSINVLVEKNLVQLLKRFRIVHQTGDSLEFRDFDRISKLVATFDRSLQKHYVSSKFVSQDDLGVLFESADFVISRAGVKTITELIFFEKPAFLIPLNKEQKQNAEFFAQSGIGEYAQDSLSKEDFLEKIIAFSKRVKQHQHAAEKLASHIPKDASDKIVSIILNEKKKT